MSTGMPIERLLEPARPQIGHDLERLALDGRADRGVMQHGDAPRGAQPRQRALELDRLVDRFLHEALGGRLAPGTQRRPTEAARQSPSRRRSPMPLTSNASPSSTLTPASVRIRHTSSCCPDS